MNDSKPENDCGLIIDPAVLVNIREACKQRRAELEAAGALPPLRIAPGLPQSASAALPAPSPISEAERFALALGAMPPRVRGFFEREESPYVPPHCGESEGERFERRLLGSIGCWCG